MKTYVVNSNIVVLKQIKLACTSVEHTRLLQSVLCSWLPVPRHEDCKPLCQRIPFDVGGAFKVKRVGPRGDERETVLFRRPTRRLQVKRVGLLAPVDQRDLGQVEFLPAFRDREKLSVGAPRQFVAGECEYDGFGAAGAVFGDQHAVFQDRQQRFHQAGVLVLH